MLKKEVQEGNIIVKGPCSFGSGSCFYPYSQIEEHEAATDRALCVSEYFSDTNTRIGTED